MLRLLEVLTLASEAAVRELIVQMIRTASGVHSSGHLLALTQRPMLPMAWSHSKTTVKMALRMHYEGTHSPLGGSSNCDNKTKVPLFSDRTSSTDDLKSAPYFRSCFILRE